MDTHDLIKQGKVGVAFRDILMGALVLTMSLAWRSVIEKGLHIVVMQSHWFDDDATDSLEEVYQDKLTNKQVADGYQPWTDTFDLDEFYQYQIDDKSIKKTAAGWTLNKMKRTIIRKHKPFHQL